MAVIKGNGRFLYSVLQCALLPNRDYSYPLDSTMAKGLLFFGHFVVKVADCSQKLYAQLEYMLHTTMVLISP